MKEFDFDELDKAVNSLMSTMPADGQTAPKPDDDVKTVTLATTSAPAPEKLPTEDFEHHNTTSLDDGAPKADDTADETALTAATSAETPEEDKTRTPTIAPRRSGRFMDMVHASGDPTKVKKAPSELPSRVGRTVAPSSGAPIVDVMKPKSGDSVVTNRGYVGDSSTSTPSPDELAANDDTATETSEAAPSPENGAAMLSTHGSTLSPLNPDVVPETTTPEAEEPHLDEDAKLADALSKELPNAEPAPSPFLPDAKVEKRPLGGTTDDGMAPAVSGEPVPAELSSDLMAIEAGENGSQVHPEPAVAATPEPITPTPEVVAAPVEKLVSPAAITPAEPLLESGPISIPQQYQEAPNSGDQSNGAIYDTASYHQPLAHPAKKKSGWWVVLIIVGIILLGAGAGAFAYFQGYF